MVYMHRETGVRGNAAKELMAKFIREVQDTKWEWVPTPRDDDPESPIPVVRSAVIEPARVPKPRKGRRESSPFQLEDPDITLEEPPIKLPRTDTGSLCISVDLQEEPAVGKSAETENKDINHKQAENQTANVKEKGKYDGKKKVTEKQKTVPNEKLIVSEKPKEKSPEKQKGTGQKPKMSSEKQKLGENSTDKSNNKQTESVAQKEVISEKESVTEKLNTKAEKKTTKKHTKKNKENGQKRNSDNNIDTNKFNQQGKEKE